MPIGRGRSVLVIADSMHHEGYLLRGLLHKITCNSVLQSLFICCGILSSKLTEQAGRSVGP